MDNEVDDERDQLLMDTIMDCGDGEILNIVQAAHELPGPLYDRFSMGYHEIMGKDIDPSSIIILVDDDEEEPPGD